MTETEQPPVSLTTGDARVPLVPTGETARHVTRAEPALGPMDIPARAAGRAPTPGQTQPRQDGR